MASISSLLLAILLVHGQSTGVYSWSGVKIQLTRQGLDAIARLAAGKMAEEMMNVKPPDIYKIISLGINDDLRIADVLFECTVSDFEIKNFTSPTSVVKYSPETGYSWSMWSMRNEFYYEITGHWENIVAPQEAGSRGYGPVLLTGSTLSVLVPLKFDKDEEGGPIITATDCSADLGTPVASPTRANIDAPDPPVDEKKIISQLVQNSTKVFLEKQICETAKKLITEDAASLIASVRSLMKINENYIIDNRLSERPLLTSEFLLASFNGEVRHIDDHVPTDIEGRELYVTRSLGHLAIYFTEYFANTLGMALHKHRLRHTIVKESVFRYWQSYFFTTCTGRDKCIGSTFPKVAEMYPNSEIEIALRSDDAPKVRLLYESFEVTINGIIALHIRGQSALPELVSVQTHLNGSAKMGMKNDKYIYTVNRLDHEMMSSNSSIGPVPEHSMEEFMDFAVNCFIKIKLNQLGRRGFQLPTFDNHKYLHPWVTHVDGAIVFKSLLD